MHSKRLIASFAAVVVLLAVAGVLELLLLAFPASDADADRGSGVVAEASSGGGLAGDSDAFGAEGPDGDSAYGDGGVPIVARVIEASQPSEHQRMVAGLLKSDSIVFDGKPLSRQDAERLAERAASFTASVEHIDQRPILPSGCEVIALTVALRAEGYQADPVVLADNDLKIGGDFTIEYVGSPRKRGGGFPACIADAGNAWFARNGRPGRAIDMTGTTFEGVVELVDLGYPVISWTTENMAAPVREGEVIDGLQWYKPEHCVVVYGVEGDEVLVSDSLAGLVRRNRADFARIYGECGNLAVLVEPEVG